MFPTKEEFIEAVSKEKDSWDMKWEFYCDYTTPSFSNNNIMTDATSESYNEDEQDWLNEQSEEELWKAMLPCAQENWINGLRKKVPMDIVKKYADEEELKELQRLEDLNLIEGL